MLVNVDGKDIELKEKAIVLDALKNLNLNPEIFIVSRDDEIVHEHEPLHDKDNLRLIRVISGG